jgi:nucleotide-binding universal stress UspA family protein
MKTNTMKKVLIALDYDPTAQKVAETGYLLARTMGAEVLLMHVVADGNYYSTLEYSPIMGFTGFNDIDISNILTVDELKIATKQYLDNTKHHLGDDNIQTFVKEGDTAESIIKTAKNLQADIIVIGTHSRRWLEEILLGSVTEKVIHHSSIPVLIIPTKKHN